MAFNPILTDQPLSYAYNRIFYRNEARENRNGLNTYWGIPVYFAPHDRGYDLNGFGGPHYEPEYNYNNSPETAEGNCTWWCCGRLREALGKNIMPLMNWASPNAVNWYSEFTGTKYSNALNAVPGDIIVFSDSSVGHVMFIEKIESGIIYISHSAWSTRSYWSDYACRVNSYNVNEIYAGNSVNMYTGEQFSHIITVVGIIHTGDDPEPTNIITRLLPFILRRRKRMYVKIN